MADGAVVAFCRLPVPGQVKTRLAAGVGNTLASTLYQSCSEQVIQRAASADGIVLVLACSIASELSAVQGWMRQVVKSEVKCVSQPADADLGGRMHWALSMALQSASKALVIGTDIPDLTAAVLHNALQLLSTYEIVLGPAHDGGFYLIGATKLHPDLLKGITWSASTTRDETVANAKSLGLTVCAESLPLLHDIDTIQDLRAWHNGALESGKTDSKFYAEASSVLKTHQSLRQDSSVDAI